MHVVSNRTLPALRRSRTRKHGNQVTLVFWLSVYTGITGTFLFGYSLGVLNTALDRVSRVLKFDIVTIGSLTFTLLSLGAIPGSLIASPLADRIGPKRAMSCMLVFVIVGAALDATAQTAAHLLVARFVMGIGAGGEQATVPRYIIDISPSNMRGLVGSLAQMALGLGVLVSCIWGLPYHFNPDFRAGGLEWFRLMLFFPGILAVVMMALLLACPESPTFYAWKHQYDRELASLRRLLKGGAPQLVEALSRKMDRAPNKDVEGAYSVSTSMPSTTRQLSEAPMEGIEKRTLSLSSRLMAAPQSIREQWHRTRDSILPALERKNRRMVLLAVVIPSLLQLCGINTVIFYSSQIYGEAGFASPVIGAIIGGAVNFLGCLPAALLSDRVGRKTLFYSSFAVMSTSLWIVSSTQLAHLAVKVRGSISLAFLLLFTAGFTLGIGSLAFPYASEVLLDELKGPVLAFSTALSFFWSAIIGLTFPRFVKGTNGVGIPFFMYSGLNVLGFLFTWFYVIETKGRSVQEVHDDLHAISEGRSKSRTELAAAAAAEKSGTEPGTD